MALSFYLLYIISGIFSAFWIMAVFKIGFLLVAFLLGRLQGWKGLQGYGLGLRMGWWQQLLKDCCLGWYSSAFLFSLAVRSGYETYQGIAPISVIIRQLPLILLMTAFPSVAEDILTRGYLYGHLLQRWSPGTGCYSPQGYMCWIIYGGLLMMFLYWYIFSCSVCSGIQSGRLVLCGWLSVFTGAQTLPLKAHTLIGEDRICSNTPGQYLAAGRKLAIIIPYTCNPGLKESKESQQWFILRVPA